MSKVENVDNINELWKIIGYRLNGLTDFEYLTSPKFMTKIRQYMLELCRLVLQGTVLNTSIYARTVPWSTKR